MASPLIMDPSKAPSLPLTPKCPGPGKEVKEIRVATTDDGGLTYWFVIG